MPRSLRPSIMSRKGVVAAAHPLAAQAGATVLQQGGNAFDAAVATAAALNVVEPFMSGLAGLGLATMWVAAEKRVRVLDFVPPIPASFPQNRFSLRDELHRGPYAIATPANLAGWCEISAHYGRLPLAEALAPAIALAEDGFALSEFGVFEFNQQLHQLLSRPDLYQSVKANYLPDIERATLGTFVIQRDLAQTLKDIGRFGPEHFYTGPVGQAVIGHIQSQGGTLSLDDLSQVKPVWREPFTINYRETAIHVPPPPCEGFQFLLTLKVLEQVDLKSLPRDSVDHLDRVYRAIRLAAGIRIAHNNPSPDRLAPLFSPAALASIVAQWNDGKPITGPTEQWMPDAHEPSHTTSFSIGDSEGNLICITQSLGSPFGSGVVVPGTGLCMNNFLYWADVQTGSPNRAHAGDALPICMSPSISTQAGQPVLALGTPGSYGILQTQVQAITQYLDFGLPLQAAIEAPRARLWDGRRVQIENRIPLATTDALKQRGHEVERFDTGWAMPCGGMQAVAVDPVTSIMTGAADPRRDGYAIAI